MKPVLAFFSLLLAASIWVYEIDSDVYMRKKPDNKAKIIRTMRGGEKVVVLEQTNEYWWKVNFQGKEGYIAASFIVVAIPETANNLAQALLKLIMTYPPILGIILFMIVFWMIRSWQRRRA